MISLVRPCKGPTSGDNNDPWRQPTPTWREEDHNGSYGGRFPRWQVEAIVVPARGTPLMAPLVGESRCYIPGTGFSGRHSLPRIMESFALLQSEEHASEQLLALRPMAAMGSKASASSNPEENNGSYKR